MTNYDQHQQLYNSLWTIEYEATNKLFLENAKESLSISSSSKTETTNNEIYSNVFSTRESKWCVEVNNVSIVNIAECMKWRRLSFGKLKSKYRNCSSSYINCSFLILIIIFNCIWSCLLQPTLAIGKCLLKFTL